MIDEYANATIDAVVAVVTRQRWTILALYVLLTGSAVYNVVQYIEGRDLQEHVEYLEEYINENSLPIPAIRINIGDDNE